MFIVILVIFAAALVQLGFMADGRVDPSALQRSKNGRRDVWAARDQLNTVCKTESISIRCPSPFLLWKVRISCQPGYVQLTTLPQQILAIY